MMGMGGMNGMATPGMDGTAAWAINGHSMTGDGQADMPPMLTFGAGAQRRSRHARTRRRGGTRCICTAIASACSAASVAVPFRQWADTVLVPPKEAVECAFVADNPGDWMLHCHVMDHQTPD